MPTATTMCATTSPPSASTRCRSIPAIALLRQFSAGWSFSETAFLHSGLPFSVLSQPYSANGNGVFQAERRRPPVRRAELRQPGARRAALSQDALSRRHRRRNEAMAQSRRVCLGGRSGDRRMTPASACRTIARRSASSATPAATRCAGRTSRTRTFTSRRRFRSGKASNCVSTRRCSMPSIIPILRCPARSRPACPARIPARFGTLAKLRSPPTGLLGVGLGGDSSPRMIAFQGRIEF